MTLARVNAIALPCANLSAYLRVDIGRRLTSFDGKPMSFDPNNDQFNESPFEEPPLKKGDTRPTQTVPAVNMQGDGGGGIGRVLMLVIALGASGIALAAIALLVLSGDDNDTPTPQVVQVTRETPRSILPTATTPPQPTEGPQPAPTEIEATEAIDVQPDLSAATVFSAAAAQTLLDQPLSQTVADEATTSSSTGAFRIGNGSLNPFTIIPDRPRDTMEQYTVVQGDTIDTIANRFGLQSETIAWSNPRSIIQVLRPGDVLQIPPMDGVYEFAQGIERTLGDYAEQFNVDVQTVLNHPVNREIANLPVDSVPPSGTPIFFPGGEAELIVWRAEIEVSNSGGGGGGGGVPTVRFQPGQPGDCGNVVISGGTAWTNPMPNGYTITRGYSPAHPGIDLAAPTGTPIYAANGGVVIFSGWNSYGYGNMVAIIHGPTMTVYGHMNTLPVVGCEQWVDAGALIGYVGSTGNSSGPHLHFEIRSGANYSAGNPSATIGF